jgi:hypothetical protein
MFYLAPNSKINAFCGLPMATMLGGTLLLMAFYSKYLVPPPEAVVFFIQPKI